MKTVVTEKVVMDVKSLQLGYWDDEKEDFIPIEDATDEVVTLLAVSPAFLNVLITLVEDIKDKVGRDLADIWKRLDAIEGK